MTIEYILFIIKKRWKWFLILPLFVTFGVYMLSKKAPDQYSSRMTLYTGLASGASIGAGDNDRIDYAQASLAYENLINILTSDRTLENVGLRLLANVLISNGQNREFILKESWSLLRSQLPKEIFSLVDKNSLEKTEDNLRNYMLKDNVNYVRKLLNGSSYFSKSALSRITAKRIKNSDIMELSYIANDPAICYQTLRLVYDEAIRNFKMLKKAQSDDIVYYFTEQLDSSAFKLNSLESDLVKFNQENKLINFAEQTKYVVIQKTDIDQQYDQLEMINKGAESAIKQMELKMGLRGRLMLKSKEVLLLRDQISQVAMEKAIKTSLETDSVRINAVEKRYDKRLHDLKINFTQVLDSIGMINTTGEGISIENILSKWLDGVIQFEQTKAQLPILAKRSQMLENLYEVYAPIGATVKRKERSIDVNERQYLSLLSSLNSAKMRERDVEISSNAIKVLDEPKFPDTPLPSKSMLLSLIGGIATLILLLVLSFISEYFDRKLDSPYNIERLMKRKVDFMYPFIVQDKRNQSVGYITRIITLEILRSMESNNVQRVNFLSLYSGEGKSFVINEIQSGLSDCKNGLDKIDIIELPALIDNYVSINSLKAGCLNILVCNTNRTIKRADIRLMNELFVKNDIKVMLLLNGVSISMYELYFGLSGLTNKVLKA